MTQRHSRCQHRHLTYGNLHLKQLFPDKKDGKMQYFSKKVLKKFGVLNILLTFAPANKTVRDVAQSG